MKRKKSKSDSLIQVARSMQSNPPPLNPHAYRKMEQAQDNMKHCFKTGNWRRARYWGRLFGRWTEKLIDAKKYSLT